jgi:hypothetical protein
VAGSCEHISEPFGSIKLMKFPDTMERQRGKMKEIRTRLHGVSKEFRCNLRLHGNGTLSNM